MPAFQFQVDVMGSREIEADFRGIGEKATDIRPAWVIIREELERILTRQFDSEGRYRSGGWQPLKEETISRKAGQGLDPRILHATLRLRQSLTGTSPDQEFIATHSWMLFGSKVPYAGLAHRKRQIIKFNETDRIIFMRIIKDYIMSGALRGTGGRGTSRLSVLELGGRLDREMGQAIL